MRTLIFASLVVCGIALNGCATFERRWERVVTGQSREDAIRIMGEPSAFGTSKDKVSWNYDDFTQCSVVLLNNQVWKKSCVTDEESKMRYIQRQQAAAAMWMQMQQQNRAPSYQPMNIYQPARPVQTNCSSRWNGSSFVSDCTSVPSGIDTGIYQNAWH